MLNIDLHHLGHPHVIGAYVLLGDAPTLVDPGPASTLPALEAGMAAHGLALSDLRAIVLTHIHLDHAGATGTIVARNEQVQVYVHERGAPHLVSPDRLLSSALRLYGDEMERLWGEMLPLPPAAITTLQGGERLAIGGHVLHAYNAPGHAKHHLVYLDEQSGTAFVGDNGGVRLPDHSYVRPATPPPDIDLEQWDATLDMILGLGPQALALTHFGLHRDVARHLASYRERLHAWAEFVRVGLASGASEAEQIAALGAYAEDDVGGSAEQRALYQRATAVEQSWQGLARYWRKRLHT